MVGYVNVFFANVFRVLSVHYNLINNDAIIAVVSYITSIRLSKNAQVKIYPIEQ
jgi:hypothetical protein